MTVRPASARSLAYAGLVALAFTQLFLLGFTQVEWGAKCNESCTRTPGWTHWADSWQWSALLWLPFVALVATCISIYARERLPLATKLVLVVSITATIAVVVLALTSDLRIP